MDSDGLQLEKRYYTESWKRVQVGKQIEACWQRWVNCRIHTETTEFMAFRTFITMYSSFRRDWLSVKIHLTRPKAPIGCAMTYTCPAWEFAADICLKLQSLQNEVR